MSKQTVGNTWKTRVPRWYATDLASNADAFRTRTFPAENEVIYAPAHYRGHAVLLEKFACFSSITNSLQISIIDSLDRRGSRKTPYRYRMLVQGKRGYPGSNGGFAAVIPDRWRSAFGRQLPDDVLRTGHSPLLKG